MDPQLLDILFGFRTLLAALLILQIAAFGFMAYAMVVMVRAQHDIHREVRDVAQMTQEVLRRTAS